MDPEEQRKERQLSPPDSPQSPSSSHGSHSPSGHSPSRPASPQSLGKIKRSMLAGGCLPSGGALITPKANVVVRTCDKCIFQMQLGETEQLLKGWFPKSLKFGPHIVTAVAADAKRDHRKQSFMQCAGALDCMACFADMSHDFDIFVDGVLLHSKREHRHGFPGLAFGGQIATQSMIFRQASLRQAIADILDGKEPVMENEAEVEFNALRDKEDRSFADVVAAKLAVKKAEQEAWLEEGRGRAESEEIRQKSAAPQSKAKARKLAKANRETKGAAARGPRAAGEEQQSLPDSSRPDEEDVVTGTLPWGFMCCCRQSDVPARGPCVREDDEAPVQVV